MKNVIEFDFNKWGKEGISVKIEGRSIASLNKHASIPDCFYGHYKDSMNTFCLYSNMFQMYEEVKPREWYMNLYSDGNIAILDSKIQAESVFNDGVLKSRPNIKCETIKIVEVLY